MNRQCYSLVSEVVNRQCYSLVSSVSKQLSLWKQHGAFRGTAYLWVVQTLFWDTEERGEEYSRLWACNSLPATPEQKEEETEVSVGEGSGSSYILQA